MTELSQGAALLTRDHQQYCGTRPSLVPRFLRASDLAAIDSSKLVITVSCTSGVEMSRFGDMCMSRDCLQTLVVFLTKPGNLVLSLPFCSLRIDA